MIKKYKVAEVKTKKDGNGVTVELGAWSKNEKFKYDVEIIVKDYTGKVVGRADTTQKRSFLQVLDPRKAVDREGNPLSEERLAKIPEKLKSELFLIVEE